MVSFRLCASVALSLALAATAAPRSHITKVTRVRGRAAHDNTVKVFSKDHYWCAYISLSFRGMTIKIHHSLILPR